MKTIAIPTKGDHIEDHFGQCEYYTIVKTDEKNDIISKEAFSTPEGCGCKSNLAEILAEKGVRVMISGNMGQGAKNVLAASGIEVLCGFSGNIEHALNLYLKEGFNGVDLSCQHHHHHGGHECNH
jgi:predicted Fe-Mo cluster-binding NifX family protein